MLFNSYEFILIFLPLVLLSYYILIKLKQFHISKIVLVAVSIYFYSYGKISNFYLISCSLIINYLIYHIIQAKRTKLSLFIGIVFNVVLLGYFKYTNFIVDNLNNFLHMDLTVSKILLPLGISFFTFQQVGFLVDAYKDKTIKYSFLDYCVFITFFPQLVAGPIISHDEIIPQLRENIKFDLENFCKGLFIFSIGLAKKVLIADFLSPKVHLGFDVLNQLTFLQAWISSISYTLQLYFDFSGYCDMAIGIGLMFQINIPFNFLSPYKASSIKEFWSRWHITLTRFLTRYIYIPLGGNRKSKLRTYINVFIVYMISGVWHGAGWTFIAWGLVHALAVILNRLWSDLGFKMNKVLGWILTINFVNAAWILFRASSFDDASKLFKVMIRFDTLGQVQHIAQFGGALYLLVLVILIVGVLLLKNSSELLANFTAEKYALASGVLLTLSVLSISKLSEFIYFNF